MYNQAPDVDGQVRAPELSRSVEMHDSPSQQMIDNGENEAGLVPAADIDDDSWHVYGDAKNLDAEQCIAYISAALHYWTCPSPLDFQNWADSRFGLDYGVVVELKMVEKAYLQQSAKVWQLYSRCIELQLVGGQTEIQREMQQVFSKLFQAVQNAYFAVDARRRCINAMKNDVTDYVSPETAMFRQMSLDVTQLSDLQSLILHLLFKLNQDGLRRYKGDCYRQIVTPDGFETRAWVFECTLVEFAMRSSRKETHTFMWCNLTKRGVRKEVLEYLAICVDPEFKELKPDRGVFSFEDGIYLADKLKFLRFGRDPIPPELTACNYFNIKFPEHLCNPKDGDWYNNIPTPTFQKILYYQYEKLIPQRGEDEVRSIIMMMYVLQGRLLYDVGTHDNWSVVPFVKGIAGSGKSTMGKNCKDVYRVEDTAVMSSNAQETFGLEQLLGKFMFVCFEAKGKFRINQGDLQSVISGEPVSVNLKFKTSMTCPRWLVPGIFFGNEIPNWLDTQGNMSRRTVVFEFLRRVVTSDGNMDEDLAKERAHYILKCNLAYRAMAFQCGKMGFWEIPYLASYFKETRRRLQIKINPLLAFISDSDLWEIKPERYVLLLEFREEFMAWLKRTGNNQQRLDGDDVKNSLEEQGLRLDRFALPWGPQAQLREGYFIIGLGSTENRKDHGGAPGYDQGSALGDSALLGRDAGDHNDDTDAMLDSTDF